ncbi:MAG: hypothetical protein A3D38_01450 [Candidatus Portnoybacteria bacterium RIFCSPHIGHO2_02_FULL_40_23]|uniref:Uncharacterized protein n=2 Tax=Candidatus Portnoyibacteriota TaxID=1817913 RepID=A0A1G2FC01_9BACT|nr:MAG: hypothetical protein A2815_02035 [Candidatus Portnoybacteria bacterium RIFCSPHIGHO2_01_FULL_40_12b]OGZ37183.1 MAG: hypothetical protein A3D38_01450 [Candidatus Portnoybacteria bacterium RIFCSPHIGHO2_02_FULL_40_23]OGZ37672.1 MAG: hypothetical protein A3E90_00040 [Candidatus Portnoybacteria bacterium RIFCSPHIGHO2_12_FULL_40_11]
MPILSQPTEELIQEFKRFILTKPEEGSTIHVDYIASKVASFYERIRKILDYQEEHLLRKNAIDRMLKRRLILQTNNKGGMAESLICELIRAGYLPNDAIPESEIGAVELIISKYVFLIDASADLPQKQREGTFNWLISLASCEIEEKLAPPHKDQALADYMYAVIKERIVLRNTNLNQDEKDTQVFIAIQKALLRTDRALLNYRLLKWHYPEWTQTDQQFLTEIIPQIASMKLALSQKIDHPLGPKFFKICNQYNTPYLVLGDVLLENSDALNQPERLEDLIKEAYQERYKRSKNKLRRAAVLSTLSIFVTKILLALAIEVPFDLYIAHQLILLNLGINILFPPLLMFLIVKSIKPPKEENAQKVVLEVMKITYQTKTQDQYEIKTVVERNVFLRGIINLFYLITFLVTFGLIIWALDKLNFSWLSMVIFLVFISLICFAGLRIRQRSKELSVEKEKESGWVFWIELFALPLVRVGKWLSNQWTRFNILVVIFDLILEVPFQIFVQFLENWRRFLKEKKEEIQ